MRTFVQKYPICKREALILYARQKVVDWGVI
jgi:hypothetical protein